MGQGRHLLSSVSSDGKECDPSYRSSDGLPEDRCTTSVQEQGPASSTGTNYDDDDTIAIQL